MRSVLPYRARLASLVCASLLTGTFLGVLVPLAHAEATAESAADLAFTAGQSTEPPTARSSVVLPDGDVVQGGRITAPTTFGDTVLGPTSDGLPGSFLARLSADGMAVRWTRDLGGSGHLAGLGAAGDALVTLRSTFSGGTTSSSASLTAWDAATGTALWDHPLFGAQMLVEPDLAVARDGALLVAGTYRGSLDLGATADSAVSPSQGAGFVLALDPATGTVRWGRTFIASTELDLQSVAVAPNGRVYAAGLFMGTFTTGGSTLASPGYPGKGFLVALTADGDSVWSRSYDNLGGYPQFDDLAATDEHVFARTAANVVPGVIGSSVAALSVADGGGEWAVPMPSTSFESPVAPLTVLANGTVAAGLTFSGDTVLASQRLASRGGTDVALLGVAADDGRTRFVRQLGDVADDVLQGLGGDGDDLLLSGGFAAPLEQGGVVENATFARMSPPRRLSVFAPSTGTVRSDVSFSVVSEPSDPVTVSVTGPCSLLGLVGGSGSVHLDHVGTCVISATQTSGSSPLQVASSLQVLPMPSVLGSSWSPAISWPTAVPSDLGARFTDPHGTPVPGEVSYSIPAGTALEPGTYPVVATFRSADPDIADGTALGTLRVYPSSPQVTWVIPSSLVYGTPLSGSSLDAHVTGLDGAPVAGDRAYQVELRTGNDSRYVSAAGVVLPAGDHVVQLYFTSHDPDYGPAWTSRTVTVTKAASHLDARFAKLKNQLTAVLMDSSNGVPIVGQHVAFSMGNQWCTVTTDATGTATCDLNAFQLGAVVRYGFTALYEGDSNHAATSTRIPASSAAAGNSAAT
jgi:hypothetical protein